VHFVFTDAGDKTLGLHLRRGVVEFVENPARYPRKADLVLTLDRKTWAEIYLGQSTIAQLADQGRLDLEGDPASAEQFFALFDPFRP
jgi:alkyl sulfatase BDS1-like metallo-beta-lactamase superfamily hydrolase